MSEADLENNQPGSGVQKQRLNSKSSRAEARIVFIQTLILNLLVSISKLICGFMTNTLSMVADGFHSLLDASSNIIGILGLSISIKPADEGHPYGHRKFEALGAMAISFLMFFAGYEVLSGVIERLSQNETASPDVMPISYIVVFFSIAINIMVADYEKRKAKELRSQLLHADAQHTSSDIYVSIGVLVTLVCTQLGLTIVDIIVSVLIVLTIFKAGFGIIMEHLGTLVDAKILEPEIVSKIVLSVQGVRNCHKIRSRGLADHVFLDLHVLVDEHLTVKEAHVISTAVEEKLKVSLEGIEDVVVHIEEYSEKN
jgi:cation diffusion facilitator family transporter